MSILWIKLQAIEGTQESLDTAFGSPSLRMHVVWQGEWLKVPSIYAGFVIAFSLFSHGQTFANGSNFRSHKKKSHPAELAAYESSGKATSAGLKIPRLDQLQPKNDLIDAATATTSDEIIHHHQTSTTDYVDIKQELPPLMISSSDNFQIHHIIP